MVVGPITMTMLKHHGIINKLLSDFEKTSAKDKKKAEGIFYSFKWNLEKHFFVEEINIFPITDRNNRIESNQLNNLLRDHKDFRKIVDNLEDELNEGKKPAVNILKELLFAHEKRETESFYPRLDSRLSKVEAGRIIGEIGDIKIG